MRQERIRKTQRRRARQIEFPPLRVVSRDLDITCAECVLDRIATVLEAA